MCVLLGLLCAAPVSTATGAVELPAIHVLDLRPTFGMSASSRYDLWHAAVCLQGLANRDAPRVFLIFHDGDQLWFNRLREPGVLCGGWSLHQHLDIHALYARFASLVKGVVVYDADPNNGVISTSLAATTAAGVEDAIALRKDANAGSLYRRWAIDANGPRLPVLVDLTGKFSGSGTIWQTTTPSTSSAKCDAYIWAKQKYLDSGQCDPTVLSYTLDLWGLKLGLDLKTQLSNLDYAIARRGFCFELSPWGDERPNDDPTQQIGTDRETFKRILEACNNQTQQQEMIKFVGFLNWPYKYTDAQGGNHGGVAGEWETAKLLTAYNAYKEADAAGLQYISNASFYQGLYPEVERRRHIQNAPPSYAQLQARGHIDGAGHVRDGNYTCIGLGDYDQASWTLYWLAGDRYDDPARGLVDCNWGINPNAVDRAAVAMDYMYRKKSSRDFFMSWDSGAGYVNPTRLHGTRSPSGFPSGVAIWQQHCKRYYRLFDYSISGWLLNGSAGALGVVDFQNFAPFSGDGIGFHEFGPTNPALIQNVPIRERRGPDSWPSNVSNFSGINFNWHRTVLLRPTDLRNFVNSIEGTGNNRRFLDIYSFYYLMRHHLGGNNFYRATWVADTFPRVQTAGRAYDVSVTVRNDGWDMWTTDDYVLFVQTRSQGGTIDTNTYPLPANSSVSTGQEVTISFVYNAPAVMDRHALTYDMLKLGVGTFQTQNNIEMAKEIVVAARDTDIDTDGDGAADVTEERLGSLWWHPDDVVRFPGDFDQDGDLDQSDFGRMQACISGAGVHQNDPGCVDARLDEDADVDIEDVIRFLSCMAGPGDLSGPDCLLNP